MSGLDAYEKPPAYLRDVFKKYQRLSPDDYEGDFDFIDLVKDLSQSPHLSTAPNVDIPTLVADGSATQVNDTALAYTCSTVPGLTIVPSWLSEDDQRHLISRLLHRDLSDRQHQTNLHKHYHVPYDALLSRVRLGHDLVGLSFFDQPAESDLAFEPIDPKVHKVLSIGQVLNKKLRWITLGGQYDWTAKAYPDETPPGFPADIAGMIRTAFPDTNPEAAICNVYSPGDTLSLHRDVSEQAHTGLVSISIGCDALFVVGLGEGEGDEDAQVRSRHVVVRLTSGSTVYMSGPSRHAWHGVPRVIEDTCPKGLASWPWKQDEEGRFAGWQGWLGGKRVNLNVRQMF